MRLPYLQLRMEVIEQSAPDIAVMLDAKPADICWGLIHLFKWGLGQCPDEVPPSVSSLIRGPRASMLVARAALWKGDPEEFITACETVRPPLVERMAGGIRLRGLKTYDAAWGKNHPEDWKKWRAFWTGAGPDPMPSRSETGPKPVRTRAEDVPTPEPSRSTIGSKPGDPGAPDADADADADADGTACLFVDSGPDDHGQPVDNPNGRVDHRLPTVVKTGPDSTSQTGSTGSREIGDNSETAKADATDLAQTRKAALAVVSKPERVPEKRPLFAGAAKKRGGR